uniref:Uncharacterized protein n=1 Tax=Arundo donax TaxID=35708 RepID=A0A0A9CFM2_ARUDO
MTFGMTHNFGHFICWLNSLLVPRLNKLNMSSCAL